MSLVDQIEELGAAVDAGLLPRDRAVQLLTEYSDGGLTRLGAADVLDNWQTTRAAYADIRMQAELGIAACEAAIRARRQQYTCPRGHRIASALALCWQPECLADAADDEARAKREADL